MDNVAANNTPQESRIWLHEVPAWMWVLGAWLFWAAIHWQSAIPAGAVGLVVWNVLEKQRKAREEAARVGACANVCGAQIVCSSTPYEGADIVAQRAAQWRKDLEASGNIYWDKIPIIEYPFMPMIYGVGQLTYAWDIYRREVGEKQHQANLDWVDKAPKELRGAILTQMLPAARQEENLN